MNDDELTSTLKQIVNLQMNNKEEIDKINQAIGLLHQYFAMMQNEIQVHDSSFALLGKCLNEQSTVMDNLIYEVMATERDESFFYPIFRTNEETLRLIIEEKKSLGRFGDGEFAIAAGIDRQKFQCLDEKLAKRLRQVLTEENEDYLVALANHYGNLEPYTEKAKRDIRLYLTKEVRLQHRELISLSRVYSDAYLTRPYVIYKDHDTDAPRKRFAALKTIWQDKDIFMVEGAQTRLGVGNDLFDGAKSIKRIIAPPTNSFDRYDDILKYCLENGNKADLFVLAIGPSAGVLAFDLSKNGLQGVDVGHVDMEYEWYLAGKGDRIAVPHKYNNEVVGGDVVSEIHDEKYEFEIVADFR